MKKKDYIIWLTVCVITFLMTLFADCFVYRKWKSQSSAGDVSVSTKKIHMSMVDFSTVMVIFVSIILIAVLAILVYASIKFMRENDTTGRGVLIAINFLPAVLLIIVASFDSLGFSSFYQNTNTNIVTGSGGSFGLSGTAFLVFILCFVSAGLAFWATTNINEKSQQKLNIKTKKPKVKFSNDDKFSV